MFQSSTRTAGDPVEVGWSIGHAPLWLRGIRLIEGEGGSAPAGGEGGQGGAPAGNETPPAASPTDVAAMLAALGKTNAPAAASTPQEPATPQVQQLQGFTPEQVQKLMTESQTAQQAAQDAQIALAAMQKERDEAQAQIAAHARESAVTTAADGKANAALLLDSAKFQAAVKDIDLTDAAKLGAAVEQFVKDNPAYAAVAAPSLPGTSGAAPTGGTTTKPTTLEGAVAARLAG